MQRHQAEAREGHQGEAHAQGEHPPAAQGLVENPQKKALHDDIGDPHHDQHEADPGRRGGHPSRSWPGSAKVGMQAGERGGEEMRTNQQGANARQLERPAEAAREVQLVARTHAPRAARAEAFGQEEERPEDVDGGVMAGSDQEGTLEAKELLRRCPADGRSHDEPAPETAAIFPEIATARFFGGDVRPDMQKSIEPGVCGLSALPMRARPASTRVDGCSPGRSKGTAAGRPRDGRPAGKKIGLSRLAAEPAGQHRASSPAPGRGAARGSSYVPDSNSSRHPLRPGAARNAASVCQRMPHTKRKRYYSCCREPRVPTNLSPAPRRRLGERDRCPLTGMLGANCMSPGSGRAVSVLGGEKKEA